MFDLIKSTRLPVMFTGNNRNGWGNYAAGDPDEVLTLNFDDSEELIVEFVQSNKGKFIAGFITFEYTLKKFGFTHFQELDGFPATEFRSYKNFETFHETKPVYENIHFTFKPALNQQTYYSALKQINTDIRNGEYYQLNYTFPLYSVTHVLPHDLYAYFRFKNQTEYSCYFESQDWAIHSLSPELFIKIEHNEIMTQPIKGTIPRGKTDAEDQINLQKLMDNEKEKAELYMIIDMLRNDVGKISKIGSVKVLEARSIQKLEKVFHTYGVVSGTLNENVKPIEVLLSMLPGGSVTGCPKKRACQAITDLEKTPRGIYTGTIGYILPDGTLHFNMAIRTVLQKGNQLSLGVGGGITIGSIPELEYAEALAKAESFQP